MYQIRAVFFYDKRSEKKEELVRENADLKKEVEALKRQLAFLKRAAFRQKSEKRSAETNLDQLSHFNETEKNSLFPSGKKKSPLW